MKFATSVHHGLQLFDQIIEEVKKDIPHQYILVLYYTLIKYLVNF